MFNIDKPLIPKLKFFIQDYSRNWMANFSHFLNGCHSQKSNILYSHLLHVFFKAINRAKRGQKNILNFSTPRVTSPTRKQTEHINICTRKKVSKLSILCAYPFQNIIFRDVGQAKQGQRKDLPLCPKPTVASPAIWECFLEKWATAKNSSRQRFCKLLIFINWIIENTLHTRKYGTYFQCEKMDLCTQAFSKKRKKLCIKTPKATPTYVKAHKLSQHENPSFH